MKTYFVFGAMGQFFLVASANNTTRVHAYPKFPAQTIDILRNLGYKRV